MESILAQVITSVTSIGLSVYFLKQFIEETKKRIDQNTNWISELNKAIHKLETEIIRSQALLKEAVLDKVDKEIRRVDNDLRLIEGHISKMSNIDVRVMNTESTLKTHGTALSVLVKAAKEGK